MTDRKFLRSLVTLAIASLISGMTLSTASAQRIGTSDDPIYVSADRAESIESQFQWDGNVKIVQGKAILTANQLVGTLDGNGDITQIVATGDVRYSDGAQAIAGKRGVYNEAARTLIMTEDVIVTQGKNVFTAGRATYWIDTGKVVFVPEAGKRVRGVFHPNSELRLN